MKRPRFSLLFFTNNFFNIYPMDQACVICKSATYYEHDLLLNHLRQQFWQMIPLRHIRWHLDEERENQALLSCTRVQGEVMKTIIYHEHTTKYSPSTQYIGLFLKKYIDLIENIPGGYDLDDELVESYVSLIASTDLTAMSAGMCFKTYTLDKEQYTRVVLKEEQMMISHGTTGLQTWIASLYLSDFFIEHPDIIRSRNVLELGAGCGLLGFVCAAMGATHVQSTDFSPMVMKLLEENRELNPQIRGQISVSELDWNDPEELCGKMADTVDVIVGSDVVYDPTIMPALVDVLQRVIVSSQQVAYITITVRNQDTADLFFKLIDDTGVLGKSVMDLSATPLTTLCNPTVDEEVCLVLVTRK